jgi:NTP pyrophosphatase (non-canonical NTP hydrolase)
MTNENEIPGLSKAEYERLAILMEEMGEAIQIIGKVLRHGYEGHHPNAPHTTNRALLELELGDVRAAIILMLRADDLSEAKMEAHARHKYEKLINGSFVYYQREIKP